MNIWTCFDILGISGDATLEEAKQAYKRLVKRWHPDQYVNDPEKHRAAHEKLTEINVAYREAVARLESSVPRPAPESEKDTAGPRDAADVRRREKKPSIFRRMATAVRNRTRAAGTETEKASGTPVKAAGQGGRVGGSRASEFQRILKRAVRNQPKRSSGAKAAEGRGRRAGFKAGRSGAPYAPAGRSRGDRVEKVRPVRRVGKV